MRNCLDPSAQSLAAKDLLNVSPRRVSVDDVDPVDIGEVMDDLRVDSDDDIETVRRILRASSDYIETRTGIAPRPGIYEISRDGWWHDQPAEIIKGPIRGGVEVEYLENDGDWVALPADRLRVSDQGRTFRLYWTRAMDWPAVEPGGDTVRLRFEAGYDAPGVSESAAAGLAPDWLRSLIIAVTAHQYTKRQAGRDTLRFANLELDPVLAIYRQYW